MSAEVSEAQKSRQSGRVVLLIFIGFFLVIVIVNAIFAYFALTSHSGVVTEQAFEKGLAYNETLEQAAEQEKTSLQESVMFENGALYWTIFDAEGKSIEGARVKARLIRPVKDGHDFEVSLKAGEAGVYSAALDAPMKGAWTAKLEATWDGQSYRTTHKFIVE
jgi:nitrogen fixation protein FixH